MMDPILVEAMRKIINKELISDIDQMRNSDMGCSLKCRLLKIKIDKQINRN
jgi:hypothetical protein